MQIRQRNPDFESKKFMEENPRSHLSARFWLCNFNCCASRQNKPGAAELIKINGKFASDEKPAPTERGLLAFEGGELEIDPESNSPSTYLKKSTLQNSRNELQRKIKEEA